MSFVPAPQQANAAVNAVVSTSAAPAAAASAANVEISDQELLFKMRTFDVFWVEKKSLMYRDGIAKVSVFDVSPRLVFHEIGVFIDEPSIADPYSCNVSVI
jgi:hypothetical protein